MTISLQNRAGEGLAADDIYPLVVLLQLVDQRHEVAVAADDGESIDMVAREGHLQGVECEVDVSAVLVPARSGVALYHLDTVLGQGASLRWLAAPVAVSHLGGDFTPLLDAFQNALHVERPVQSRLHADFNVVEVDEYCEV